MPIFDVIDPIDFTARGDTTAEAIHRSLIAEINNVYECLNYISELPTINGTSISGYVASNTDLPKVVPVGTIYICGSVIYQFDGLSWLQLVIDSTTIASGTTTGMVRLATATTADDYALNAVVTEKQFSDARKAQALVNAPKGLIIAWYSATLPTGWVLCDGSNGTPNLRNRFIRGTTDSALANTDIGSSTVSVTAADLPAHTHTFSGATAAVPSHTHAFSITSGAHAYTHNHACSVAIATSTAGAHKHGNQANKECLLWPLKDGGGATAVARVAKVSTVSDAYNVFLPHTFNSSQVVCPTIGAHTHAISVNKTLASASPSHLHTSPALTMSSTTTTNTMPAATSAAPNTLGAAVTLDCTPPFVKLIYIMKV